MSSKTLISAEITKASKQIIFPMLVLEELISYYCWKRVCLCTSIWQYLLVIFSKICAKNYHSVTELHYQPYKENSGTEPLPGNVHQKGSGFVRQKPITNPTIREVCVITLGTLNSHYILESLLYTITARRLCGQLINH